MDQGPSMLFTFNLFKNTGRGYPPPCLPGYFRNTAPEWESVIHFGERIEYPRDAFICFEPYEFAFLYSGSIVRILFLNQKHERWLMFLAEKTLFNASWMLDRATGFDETRTYPSFSGVGKRHLCYRARTPILMYKFNLPSLLADPDFSQHTYLWNSMMYDHTLKTTGFMLMCIIMGMPTIVKKVAMYLYVVYQSRGTKTILDLGIGLFELANLLGLHKSSLHRALNKLKEDGILLEFSHKQIVFGDTDKLFAIIEE